MFQQKQNHRIATVRHLVLMSRKPGDIMWSVRNRCPQLQGGNIETLKAKLRALRSSWQINELQTEFKLKWINWAHA